MKTKTMKTERCVLYEVYTFGMMYHLLFNDNEEIMKLKQPFKYLSVDGCDGPGILYSSFDYDHRPTIHELYETLSNKEIEEMKKWCKNVYCKSEPLLKNKKIKSINVFKNNFKETFEVQCHFN